MDESLDVISDLFLIMEDDSSLFFTQKWRRKLWTLRGQRRESQYNGWRAAMKKT